MKKIILLSWFLVSCATTTPVEVFTENDIVECVSKLNEPSFSFIMKNKKEIYLAWADINVYQISTLDGTQIQMNQFELENYKCHLKETTQK
jgi:hypothetical protein